MYGTKAILGVPSAFDAPVPTGVGHISRVFEELSRLRGNLDELLHATAIVERAVNGEKPEVDAGRDGPPPRGPREGEGAIAALTRELEEVNGTVARIFSIVAATRGALT